METLIRNLFLTLFLAVFLFSTSSIAQQDDDHINLETNLVTVGVSVKDTKGRSITVLQKEDFQIFYNAASREVSLLLAEETPVSFGIVYDLYPTTSEQTEADT